MDNCAPAGDLEKLIEAFRKKLIRVEGGMKLADVLHFSLDGSYSLRDIASNTAELSAMNEAIRLKLEEEKGNLDAMKAQMQRLAMVRQRMNHMCYHLPNELPQLLPSVQEQQGATKVLVSKENKQPVVTSSESQKKMKCIWLLQGDDFDKLPKHVKSHLSMEQINAGISEVNHILRQKYEFLKKPRKTLSRAEDKKRGVYLEMGKDLKGTKYEIFFMDSDIMQYARLLKAKPKTRETVFLVLRHLGKMKEVRKGKPPRYCILGG